MPKCRHEPIGRGEPIVNRPLEWSVDDIAHSMLTKQLTRCCVTHFARKERSYLSSLLITPERLAVVTEKNTQTGHRRGKIPSQVRRKQYPISVGVISQPVEGTNQVFAHVASW